MKRILFSCACFLTASSAFSQVDMTTGNISSGTVYSVHGKLSTGFSESFKSGSPFFNKEWKNADVLLYDGQFIKNIPVLLNLLSDEVYYKRNDSTYVADVPIKEITIFDSGKSYHFIHGNALQSSERKWYQKESGSPAVFFKKLSKAIEESRQYGSATVERSIVTTEDYYVYYKKSLQPVKRLQDIPNILYKRKNELEGFIKSERLKKVSEESVRKMIAYYNSISGD